MKQIEIYMIYICMCIDKETRRELEYLFINVSGDYAEYRAGKQDGNLRNICFDIGTGT